MVTECPQNIPG